MGDWFKARTIFAGMFYGTYLYMVIKDAVIPDLLATIVTSLMAFYFGQRARTESK